jgi:hypothetical protein
MVTPPHHDRGPEVSGLARFRYRAIVRALRTAAVGVLCALASLVSLLSVGAVAAHADDPSAMPLALEPGWTSGPYGTGAVKVNAVDGIVRFSGAIATSGTDPHAFTLPVGFRPRFNVFVPVDMCNGTNGALYISPSGAVTVVSKNWFNAQCLTSLDGVWFVGDQELTWLNYNHTPGAWLSPTNGWWTGQVDVTPANGPDGTAPAAFEVDNGVVYFSGAIATSGTNTLAFTLPPQVRPSYNVYVNVNMCGNANGRLDIYPNGDVRVEAEGGAWDNAQCLTSLDGASFVVSPGLSPYLPSPLTELTLQPGWTGGPYGTAFPQAVSDLGTGYVVELQGAIATSGANPVAFTLPPALRPAYNRYVAVDMCNSTVGRLDIYPDGDVQVEAKGGAWGNAACFTSLDGVSFVK